jgi:two-component system response regulator
MKNPFILIADDDNDDKFLLKTIFEENAFDTPLEFVSNGVELMSFLQQIESDRANLAYPLFILLDLNMPKMDGRQALKQIKENNNFRQIPIIIFSTTKNDIEIKRCYELGANTYVVKPANYKHLSETISSIRTYWLNVASTPQQ